jgi:hypothetical protein
VAAVVLGTGGRQPPLGLMGDVRADDGLLIADRIGADARPTWSCVSLNL